MRNIVVAALLAPCLASDFFQSTDSDKIKSQLQSIGYEVLDTAGSVKDSVIDSLDPESLKSWLKSHNVEDVGSDYLAEAKKHKDWLLDDIKNYVDSAQDTANAFISKNKEFYEQNAAKVQEAAGSAAEDAKDYAADKVAGFKDAAGNIYDSVVEKAGEVKDGIIDSVKDFQGDFEHRAEDGHERVVHIKDAVVDKVGEIKDNIVDSVKHHEYDAELRAHEGHDSVKHAAENVQDFAKDRAEDVHDAAENVKKHAENQKEHVKDAASDAKQHVKEHVDDAVDAASDAKQNVKYHVDDAVDAAADAADNVKARVKGKMSDFQAKAEYRWEDAEEVFMDSLNSVENGAKDIKDNVENKVKDAKDNTEKKIKDAKKDAENKAKGAKDDAADKVDDAKEFVAENAANAKEAVENAKDNVADKAQKAKDYVYENFVTTTDKWSDDRLRKYLVSRGVDAKHSSREEMLETIQSVFGGIVSTTHVDALLDSWSAQDLKKVLKNAGAKYEGTRQELVERVSQIYTETVQAESQTEDELKYNIEKFIEQMKSKNNAHFERWNIDDLKEYLKSYGASVDGTREQLIEAAKDNYHHYINGIQSDRPKGIHAAIDSVKNYYHSLLSSLNFVKSDL